MTTTAPTDVLLSTAIEAETRKVMAYRAQAEAAPRYTQAAG